MSFTRLPRDAAATLVALACLTLGLVATPGANAHTTPSTCDQPGVDDKCEEWAATHSSAASPNDSGRPYDVAVSPDGATVFVAGEFDTVAYDANGNELWAAALPAGPNHLNPPTVYSLAVSPDSSRVYVTGQYQFPGDPYYATAAYDAATGARLWLATTGLPGYNGAGTHLGLSPDGGTLYVVGENNSACFQPTDPCTSLWGTIAYDAATGAQHWAAYAEPGSGTPYDLVVSPDGRRVYVTGNLGDTVAYDAATGARLWLAKAPGDGPGDALWSLAVSPDGSRVFATGQTCEDDGGVPCNRYVTLALDAATGAVDWVARAPQGFQYIGSYPEAGSLAVSPTGDRVFVVGQALTTSGAGDQDFDGLALAYDASSGSLVWQASYDAGSDEEWYDVGVSPDGGQVFVSGRAAQSGLLSAAKDFATAAYDTADGRRAWVARYNNGANGDGVSVPMGGLAVSPLGSSVVVAGTFSGVHSHVVPSGSPNALAWGLVSYATGTGTPVPSPWSAAGSLAAARSAHTATLLRSGEVLVAGGCRDGGNDEPCSVHTNSAELFDPATGSSTEFTVGLTVPRAGHTATLLADGRVLLAGGCALPTELVACAATPTAEIYDPGTGRFTPTGPMAHGRLLHTATLLGNGRVLVAGGRDGGEVLSSAETYDPLTGTFAPAGSLDAGRDRHTASLLGDGRVLLAGGADGAGAPLASTQLYDPVSGTFAPGGALRQARAEHTASVLGDGTVWLAGGVVDGFGTATPSAERYDPATATFAPTAGLTRPRTTHTATVLPDGRVLVAGGRATTPTGAAELFDPATGTSTRTGGMAVPRSGSPFDPRGHTATLLPDGRVVVLGGTDSSKIERYTPPPTGADLSLVMTASPDPVRVGDKLTYRIVVSNAGPLDASGVVASGSLPTSAKFSSMSTTQGTCTRSGSAFTCAAGGLAPGAATTITIVVKPGAAGSITATATVAGRQWDPDGGDNAATATTTVTKR